MLLGILAIPSSKSYFISLEKKIAGFMDNIAKVSYYLLNNALLYVILFFGTHSFTLCCITLGSTYSTHLTKLKRLQNKALRIIYKTPIITRITSQYLKLKILKLDNLYQFEMAKLMQQFIYNKVFFKLNDYFEY